MLANSVPYVRRDGIYKPVVQIEVRVDLFAADLVIALGNQDSVLDEEEARTALVKESSTEGLLHKEKHQDAHAAVVRDNHGLHDQRKAREVL